MKNHFLKTAVALVLTTGCAHAGNYKFVKVAEETATATNFLLPTMSAGGTAVFRGQPGDYGTAIYAGSGGALRTVISTKTSPRFSGFNYPMMDASGQICFVAGIADNNGTSEPSSGIYTISGGGSLTTICEHSATRADEIYPESFCLPVISNNGKIAFRGKTLHGFTHAMYRYTGGTIQQVGLNPEDDFPGISDAGAVIYTKLVATGGTYYERNFFIDGVQAVRSSANHDATFTSCGYPSFSSSGVLAFRATLEAGGSGIYTATSVGVNATIADTTGPFEAFYGVSVNGSGKVVFEADTDDFAHGLYDGPDPVTNNIIQKGDALFGSTLKSFEFWPRSLGDNGQIAILYLLYNGKKGVLIAMPSVDPGAGLIREKLAGGSVVPSAGTGGNMVVANTEWLSFGEPAVNGSGALAFRATLKVPKGAVGAKSGIFTLTGATVAQIAVAGDPVPESPTLKFVAFQDPLLADDGSLVFQASVAGPHISAASSTVVCWYYPANMGKRLVVRTGEPVAAAAGALLKRIGAIAIAPGGQVAIDAYLGATKTAKVSGANDGFVGTWTPASGLRIGLRDGQSLEGSTVKSILTFEGGTNSLGHDHGWFGLPNGESEYHLGVKVTLKNGAVLLGRVRVSDAAWTPLVGTGTNGPGLPSGMPTQTFTNIGLPNFGWGTTSPVVFRGTRSDKSTALFKLDTGSGKSMPLVSLGDIIANVAGATVNGLGDPIIGPDGRHLAWDGSIAIPATSGRSSTSHALLMKEDNGDITAVAYVGGPVAGRADGTKWKTFNAVAVAGNATGTNKRGPILVGTLFPGKGGVTSTSDYGIWGLNAEGAFRLLLQEGEPLQGSTVKKFSTLSYVSAGGGQSRTDNQSGKIGLHATKANNVEVLATVDIP